MKLSNYLTDSSWSEVLKDEFQAPYFLELERRLSSAFQNEVVYPKKEEIFTALNLTPFSKVKVVIIGQDPYHGPNQAHGLSFSVKKGVKTPPSLVNIFKELEQDLGITRPMEGNLEAWARQGVLMLNNQLSVVEGKPMSHKDIGWNEFTDKIIQVLNEKREHLVFVLWGAPAQNKAKVVDHKRHHIIKSVHPSPLSAYRGFFGSKPFSLANKYLEKEELRPIDWSLS
ncbi:MAG: uracil-DNA glycosylase [Bdellovibrionales bacterium]|nr:uracil-DNA glycosylase [Bdellovibrionales bacterium]